jgi:methylated-DNA-[protein]-cysteine S-methyltransferase
MAAIDKSPPRYFAMGRQSTVRPDSWAVVFPTELGWMACLWRGQRLAWNSFGFDSAALASAALETFARAEFVSKTHILASDARVGTESAAEFESELGMQLKGAEMAPSDSPQALRELAGRLSCFARRFEDRFTDVPLELDRLGPFTRRVVELCRAVPPGRTASYAELAIQAGSPGAARAVGNAMATNRFPLIVPCHRVVCARGHLGGYSAPQGLAMKRRLLAAEAQRGRAAHAAPLNRPPRSSFTAEP